jgi:hypothetical protein
MLSQIIRRFDTIKVVNYSHLFPTRYSVELEGLKGILSAESFKEPTQREDSKKQVKKLLEERYTSGKNKWFFQALRVCDNHSCTRRSRQQYVVLILLSAPALPTRKQGWYLTVLMGCEYSWYLMRNIIVKLQPAPLQYTHNKTHSTDPA